MRESSERTKNAEYSNTDWDHFRHANRTQFSDSFHKIFSEVLWSCRCVCDIGNGETGSNNSFFCILQIFENETENLGGDIQVNYLIPAIISCRMNLFSVICKLKLWFDFRLELRWSLCLHFLKLLKDARSICPSMQMCHVILAVSRKRSVF